MTNSGYIVLILLVLMGSSLAGADSSIPNLVGNWTGSTVGHDKNTGYENFEKFQLFLSIVGQKGRAFNGTISFSTEGGKENYTTGISGVIGPDMRSVYLAEYDKGIDIGELIGPNTLEIIYLEDGDSAVAAIDTFTRV